MSLIGTLKTYQYTLDFNFKQLFLLNYFRLDCAKITRV